MQNKTPFEQQKIKLRVPLKKGEVEYGEITIRPPLLRDIIKTDGHDPNSVGYARALLASLSGLPEVLLDQMVPEDWADIRLVLTEINMRFMGLVNLFDEKEEENENPTTAEEAGKNTPPQTFGPTSAA